MAEPARDLLLPGGDLSLQGRSRRTEGQHTRPGLRDIRLQRLRGGEIAPARGRQLRAGHGDQPGLLSRHGRAELLRHRPIAAYQPLDLILPLPDLGGRVVERRQRAWPPVRDVITDPGLLRLVEVQQIHRGGGRGHQPLR